ncbi:MAG TPA: putative sugar nucleotidyl transferase [Candidatus Eisenbacteria bacterium]
MSRALVIVEDAGHRDLRPLTDLLPVPALAFGASTLWERWRRAAGVPLLAIEARAAAMRAWHDAPAPDAVRLSARDPVLVVNAAALPGPWLEEKSASKSPAIFRARGRFVAARLDYETVSGGLGRGEGFERFLEGLALPPVEVEARRIERPWHFVEWNAAAIEQDLGGRPATLAGERHPFAVVLHPDRVSIEAGARIDPFAVLDARGGPIRIGPQAVVGPHTVVSGPCVVGAGTQLLGGAVGRSTLGPECRIAGEVEECIWQGYSNKRHHGFVGHSVIGEWVNLGALTTTSDLKNNYGRVRVLVDGREEESGVTKLGSLIGAHVKTGIGTLLPTGAAVGVGANLFGGGRFAPRHVPAFGWWDGERMAEHRIEAFLATARIAMGRRGRELTSEDEEALRALFAATAGERGAAAAPGAAAAAAGAAPVERAP